VTTLNVLVLFTVRVVHSVSYTRLYACYTTRCQISYRMCRHLIIQQLLITISTNETTSTQTRDTWGLLLN